MRHAAALGALPPSTRRLLADYAECEPRVGDLDATALRTASVRMRDIFAARATGDAWDYRRLAAWVLRREGVFRPDPPGGIRFDGPWLARLARVVALQDVRRDDRQVAVALYHLLHDGFDLSSFAPVHSKLYCDLLLWSRQDLMLEAILRDLQLPANDEGLVRADLENPHRAGPVAKPESAWWMRFRDVARFPFGVQLRPTEDGNEWPFDRLDTEPASLQRVRASTLVTVIMNVFRPDNALFGAVVSLLNQTWQELEIVVVDDGSGPEFQDLFGWVEQLDERIRLIRLPRNRGAYAARNIGLDHARGTYVTFQDHDDWSVPQRIATQVEVLEDDADLVATRAQTTKLYEDLTFAHPGYRPHQITAVTQLFRRREVMLGIGYFDEVRKGADNEFHHRLMAHFGTEAAFDMPRSATALMACRRTVGSLSRDEFRPGWRHPSRSAYRNGYVYWHRNVPRDEMFVEPRASRRFPAPRRFLSEGTPPAPRDVVVADLRPGSPYLPTVVEVLNHVSSEGRRAGLVAFESAALLSHGDAGVADSVQRLVHEGLADMIDLEEPVHVRLVLVVDPAVLQLADGDRVAWQVDEALIVEEPEATAPPNYLADDCQAAATSMFGVAPRWVRAKDVQREVEEAFADRADRPG